MKKVLLAGIVLWFVGESAHISDVTSLGVVLVVVAIGWFTIKLFSGSGSSSGASSDAGGFLYDDPWGYKEFPYEYNGQRFRTRAEMENYKDLIRDTACHHDPRF